MYFSIWLEFRQWDTRPLQVIWVLWWEIPIRYSECLAIWCWNLNRRFLHHAWVGGLWVTVGNLFLDVDHKASPCITLMSDCTEISGILLLLTITLVFPRLTFKPLLSKASFHLRNLPLNPLIVSLIRTKSSACNSSVSAPSLADTMTTSATNAKKVAAQILGASKL